MTSVGPTAELHAAAWLERSEDLSFWVQERLVNRTDAYVLYRPGRGPQTVTWKSLNRTLLLNHFSVGGPRGSIIGLHTTSLNDKCSYIAVDFDQHKDGPAQDIATCNFHDASLVADRMESIGIQPLIEDSNGAGGYHVWGLFSEPVPCREAYSIVRWCLQDSDGEHEAFPKQKSRLDTPKGYGSCLRVPGRHHTRDHWSRFFVDGRWIEGDEAIEHLLSQKVSPTDRIPKSVRNYRTPAEVETDQRSERAIADARQRRCEWQKRRDRGRLVPGEWDGSYAEQLRLAREFAQDYPPSIAGQGGHGTAMALACALRVGFELSEQDTFDILNEWNPCCQPPWNEGELRHKAREGALGREPRGGRLVRQNSRKGIVAEDSDAVLVEQDARVETRITMKEYRDGPMKAKLSSVGTPGVYFDGRSTGSGKTSSDTEAFKKVAKGDGWSLLIVPTHANAIEVEHDLQQQNLEAVRYPARIGKDRSIICPKCEGTCDDCRLCSGLGRISQFVNCWNSDAEQAEALGLNVGTTICPNCEHRTNCLQSGYLFQLELAKQAPVAIATHARGAALGLQGLTDGRNFISVHEDAIGLMRPSIEITEPDLAAAAEIARRLIEQPRYQSYFGTGKSGKERKRRLAEDEFAVQFATNCDALLSRYDRAQCTTVVPAAAAIDLPRGFPWTLYRAARERNLNLDTPALRVLLDYTTGRLHSLSIVVSQRPARGGVLETIKTLVGVWHQTFPEDKTVWFSDATGSVDQIGRLTGRPVIDVTPQGSPTRIHPTLQICRDITRATSGATIRNLLRCVMAQFPLSRRIGIITHRTTLTAIEKLGEPFSSRVARAAYFGEGCDRASNGWYKTCDLLVVIGTPRVPSDAIRKHLIRCDKREAAAESPDWLPVRWIGERADGHVVTIETRGYRDPDWKQAYRALVRSTIVQAMGRGRGLLPDGIPTVVVTVDECGALIAPKAWESGTINDSAAKVFEVIVKQCDSAGFGRESLEILLENSARISMADRTLKEHLQRLKKAGLLSMTGQGKSTRWHLVSAWSPKD